MKSRRLLVTGASGVGTTTLGRALADLWSVPHADADDYYFVPTSPPYTQKRPIVERLALMEALFLPRDSWIISGSLMVWGDPLIRRFDAVVFLALDPNTRLGRLERRETVRYGETIGQGGVNEAAHRQFLEWTRGYDDDDDIVGRTRAKHERWLAALPCPVLRLDGGEALPRLLVTVAKWDDTDYNRRS